MTARVATPLPFHLSPPGSSRTGSPQPQGQTPPRLSLPLLQALYPLPSHLPSLPPKRRNGGKGSTIETARAGQIPLSRSVDGVKKSKSLNQVNISVVAVGVSHEEKSERKGNGTCRHCAKCSRALERQGAKSRRALYDEDERPIARRADWALGVLLGPVEAEAGSCSWVSTASMSAPGEDAQAVSQGALRRYRRLSRVTPIEPASAPLASRPPSPTPTSHISASPPRRGATRSAPPPSPSPSSRSSSHESPIHSSVQLTTFSTSSSPCSSGTPPLRQRHSSPLSGSSSSSSSADHRSGSASAPVQRRKSCPPCTPLRIQVLEWRMVQCGKLAGVRMRGREAAAGGTATAGRWEA